MSIFKNLPQEFRKESGSGITDAIAMPGDIFNPVSLHYISVWTEEELAEGKESYESGDKGVRYAEIPFRAMEFFGIKSKNGATFSQKAEQAGKLQVLFNGSAMQGVNVKDVRKARLYTGKMTGNEQCILLKTDYNTHYEHQALNIVGEVDIRLSDFHKGEEEMMLVGVPENHQCDFFEHDAVYIKYEEGKREDAEAAVRRVLRRFDVPEEKIMLSSLDEYISGNYKEETYYANLLSALTVFSVLITFSGVFSMLLYSLRLRRRSMAIRRVMGAGFRDVFRPQLRSYLLYVVAGGVLAYFPAALLMHKWMEYFHYGETPGRGTDGGHRVRYMRGGVAHRLRAGAPLHERQTGGSASAGIVIRYNCFSFSGTVPVRMLSVQGRSFLCNNRSGRHRIFRAIRAHASASAKA